MTVNNVPFWRRRWWFRRHSSVVTPEERNMRSNFFSSHLLRHFWENRRSPDVFGSNFTAITKLFCFFFRRFTIDTRCLSSKLPNSIDLLMRYRIYLCMRVLILSWRCPGENFRHPNAPMPCFDLISLTWPFFSLTGWPPSVIRQNNPRGDMLHYIQSYISVPVAEISEVQRIAAYFWLDPPFSIAPAHPSLATIIIIIIST